MNNELFDSDRLGESPSNGNRFVTSTLIVSLSFLIVFGSCARWIMNSARHVPTTKMELVSRGESAEMGLRAAIRSLSWKDDVLKIEYCLTFMDRSSGYIFRRMFETAFIEFLTADGTKINVKTWDHFVVDDHFQVGWKPVLFGLGHQACDSMTVRLSTHVPEEAQYLEVRMGSYGPVTKSVQLPVRPR